MKMLIHPTIFSDAGVADAHVVYDAGVVYDADVI